MENRSKSFLMDGQGNLAWIESQSIEEKNSEMKPRVNFVCKMTCTTACVWKCQDYICILVSRSLNFKVEF